jgi:hypothetical protein
LRNNIVRAHYTFTRTASAVITRDTAVSCRISPAPRWTC